MFWIFVRIASEAILTNIQNVIFFDEIRLKQGLHYISFCLLRILYNSKFILMATSLGTNVVVVMRVHCICSQGWPRSECASMQSDQGHNYLLSQDLLS